ncbi:MAG TPA: hypothetical protein VIV11_06985 [Kofleriaceae bacterium]
MIEVATLRRRLLYGVAFVALLGLVVEVWHSRSHDEVIEALLPKLSLSYEGNLPTWLSSSLLLACAVVAGAIASARPPWHRHWWGITAVLTWMSIDEAIELHEHLGTSVELGGLLYFDWVIPAACIVVLLAGIYWPFLRALAPASRKRLLIAAAIYLGGALVVEMPLGWWTDQYGSDNLGYGLIDWVEETLEMVGITLALVALVAHRQEAQRA